MKCRASLFLTFMCLFAVCNSANAVDEPARVMKIYTAAGYIDVSFDAVISIDVKYHERLDRPANVDATFSDRKDIEAILAPLNLHRPAEPGYPACIPNGWLTLHYRVNADEVQKKKFTILCNALNDSEFGYIVYFADRDLDRSWLPAIK